MQINRLYKDGIRLSHLALNKFKTVQFQLRFFASLNARDATVRSLMFQMLKAKTKKHPSRRNMSQQVEKLYDLHFSHTQSVMGEAHVLTQSVRFAHPQYLQDDHYYEDVMSFVHQVLHQPHFDDNTLAQEKQFIKDYFDSIYASKGRYASKLFWDHMLEGHPDHISAYGDVTYLDDITLDDIQEAYQSMMIKDAVHMSLVGDLEGLSTLESFFDALGLLPRDPSWPSFAHQVTHKPLSHRYVMDQVTQERLFIAYDCPVFPGDDAYYVAIVMNQILGEGSESWLFQDIREKHSMAYDVHSSLSPAWGLLTVQAGLSFENLSKAVSIVEHTMNRLKTYPVSDDDLALAKKTLRHGVAQSYDSPRVLSYRMMREDLLDISFSLDDILQRIDAVSAEDIRRLARQLKRLTIFTLGGHNDGQTYLQSL